METGPVNVCSKTELVSSFNAHHHILILLFSSDECKFIELLVRSVVSNM